MEESINWRYYFPCLPPGSWFPSNHPTCVRGIEHHLEAYFWMRPSEEDFHSRTPQADPGLLSIYDSPEKVGICRRAHAFCRLLSVCAVNHSSGIAQPVFWLCCLRHIFDWWWNNFICLLRHGIPRGCCRRLADICGHSCGFRTLGLYCSIRWRSFRRLRQASSWSRRPWTFCCYLLK